VKCPECGNEIHKGHRYCSHCDYELNYEEYNRSQKRSGSSGAGRLIVLVLVLALVLGGAVFALGHFLHWFDGGGSPVPTEAPVTSPPTEVPVTSPPTEAPVTSPPTEAPATAAPQSSAEVRIFSGGTIGDLARVIMDMEERGETRLRLDGASFPQEELRVFTPENASVSKWNFSNYPDGEKWLPMDVEITWMPGVRIWQAVNLGRESELSPRDANILALARQTLSSLIRPGMSDLEKERAIHDYIIENCEYRIDEQQDTASIYGFYEKGLAQCSGYSDAFYLLGRMAGLNVRMHCGSMLEDGGMHAWNLIELNGSWYVLDATWDDPVGGEENGLYFNVPLNLLSTERSWAQNVMPPGNYAASLDGMWAYSHVPRAQNSAQALEAVCRQLDSGGEGLVFITDPAAFDEQQVVNEVLNRYRRNLSAGMMLDKDWVKIWRVRFDE